MFILSLSVTEILLYIVRKVMQTKVICNLQRQTVFESHFMSAVICYVVFVT